MTAERNLDPDKVRRGVEIIAQAQGRAVCSVRNHRSLEALYEALLPYCGFARLTLVAGAFGYPKTDEPDDYSVVAVVIDFLRAVGEATESDEATLRQALKRLVS